MIAEGSKTRSFVAADRRAVAVTVEGWTSQALPIGVLEREAPAALPRVIMDMEVVYLLAATGAPGDLEDRARRLDPADYAWLGAAPAAVVLACRDGRAGLYLAEPAVSVTDRAPFYRRVWAGAR